MTDLLPSFKTYGNLLQPLWYAVGDKHLEGRGDSLNFHRHSIRTTHKKRQKKKVGPSVIRENEGARRQQSPAAAGG